jgi:tRNA-splicing ligase RtcB
MFKLKMAYKENLKKIGKYEYELAKSGKMLVPGKVFISEKLLKNVEENAIQQVVNVATLPGIVKNSLAMPDLHSGYGFCIGGVAAFNLKEGIISPGGVGYDVNCGVRLLTSNIKVEEFEKKKRQALEQLFRKVPSGVGRGGALRVTKETVKEVLEKGAEWAVENTYGKKEDLKKIEENGKMKNAKPEDVSERAIQRGMPQLGSLGAGNHFLEVQKIDEIYDNNIAERFGLKKDNITIMIHCGSRGFGHQVASDYIKLMENEYGWKNLPDRELINAPIESELGQKYLSAMNCAVNFAFCNRQMIMTWVREVFEKIFPKSKLDMVYDVCHNVAKIETHEVNGKKMKVCVHRKGATRSFGPGRLEIPLVYRKVGQPVIIPGSMGTASYVLVGTKKAEEVSFGSTAHGAGRVMSRHSALRQFRGEKVKSELASKKIEIKSGSWKSIAEEAPLVYKDIDEVVKVSHEVGIGNLVARLKPLAVMKG